MHSYSCARSVSFSLISYLLGDEIAVCEVTSRRAEFVSSPTWRVKLVRADKSIEIKRERAITVTE